MVIAQALSAGRPVIASKVGGIPAMISDGITGFLWNVGDVDSLGTQIGSLLSDRSLAMRLGERARLESLARYSSSGIANATVAAYQSILGWESGVSSEC